MNDVQYQYSTHMLYFKNLYLYEHCLQQTLKHLIKMNCVVAKSWFNYFWVYDDTQAGHSGQSQTHRTNNLDW